MMSNVNLRPIQHSAVNFGRFGLLRYTLAILMVGVLFATSTACFLYAKISSDFADRVVDIGDYQIDGNAQATPDSFDGRALNILVVGTDSRNGDSGDVGAGDEEEVPGLRNDSTMVIHVSADRSRVQVVSIPRDTLVDIPACKHRDGSTSEPIEEEMFNNSMFYGADGGNTDADIAPGIACVKSTIENMSGMMIDSFMVVNFAGFIKMINALGGIWFNIPDRIEDESAQLYIDAGCWKLDGTQSLAYMRSRKGQGDGSDISRIGRQQQLISAMLRELQNIEILDLFNGELSYGEQKIVLEDSLLDKLNVIKEGSFTEKEGEGIPVLKLIGEIEGLVNSDEVVVNPETMYPMTTRQLQGRLNLNQTQMWAIIYHLGLKSKPEYHAEISVGKSGIHKYTDKAEAFIRESLDRGKEEFINECMAAYHARPRKAK